MRQALGLLPNFLIEGVQRPQKEASLGMPPVRDRAPQMGIKHLTRVMNKDTEGWFTANAHVHLLLSQFNYWPQEALESNPIKLPTLRILRLASNIPGLEYDSMPPLHQDNDIIISIREESSAVDNARHVKRTALQEQTGPKEHDKIFGNNVNRYNTIKSYSNT